MDDLLILLINAIVALFSGDSKAKKSQNAPLQPPPPMSAPPRPMGAQPPPMPRPLPGRGVQRAPVRMAQKVVRARPVAMGKRFGVRPQQQIAKPKAPVAPRPAPVPVARKEDAAPKLSAPPAPTINSGSIRQLLTSRRTALRTVFVLSEIIQPPLSLREHL